MMADLPPLGAAADWTIPQDWAAYTSAEHALWDTLFARQTAQLADRAHPAILEGLDILHLSRPGIPDFDELSERLYAATGANDTGITYKANATWRIDPDHMVYATVSRGFRPGGINRRAEVGSYASDFLENYEFGFKTSWFDRALKFNGALFWQDWSAFQFAFLGQNSFTEIHNGPNARIKGVEADVNWTVATGLTLSGSGTYTDAKTRGVLCAVQGTSGDCSTPGPGGIANYVQAPAGTRLPITPQFKINGIARYETPLTEALKGHIQGVVVHSSSAASDIRTLSFAPGTGAAYDPATSLGRLAAYTTFDFAVGLNWPFLSAEVVIENAFDKRAQLSRYEECGSCFQRPYVVANMPRTIGLRLGHSF